MTKTQEIFACLLAGFLVGSATISCGNSSSAAASTPTCGVSQCVSQADLAALKAQLRTQVVEIRPAAEVTAERARAFGLNTGLTAAPAAVTAATPVSLGTSCGYDAPFPHTTQECIVDNQGVSVIVPYPQGGGYNTAYPAYFDLAGCQGNVYVPLGPTTIASVPTTGAVVLRVDQTNAGLLGTSTYYHVSAGDTTQVVTPQAISNGNGDCEALSTGPITLLKLTTGVIGTWKAAPVGPLAPGTPN